MGFGWFARKIFFKKKTLHICLPSNAPALLSLPCSEVFKGVLSCQSEVTKENVSLPFQMDKQETSFAFPFFYCYPLLFPPQFYSFRINKAHFTQALGNLSHPSHYLRKLALNTRTASSCLGPCSLAASPSPSAPPGCQDPAITELACGPARKACFHNKNIQLGSSNFKHSVSVSAMSCRGSKNLSVESGLEFLHLFCFTTREFTRRSNMLCSIM